MSGSSQHFIERHVGGERAIIVHIEFPGQSFESAQAEFIELVRSAGISILEAISGRRDKPEPRLFIGKGKAQELCELVRALCAEVVIFNHELSPAQGRNLEKLFNCRVITRTELILDIFAQRAQTFEGKLQVELAQLQHLSTRLVRGWTHLERQKGGIGLRGPGETQLESDRRMVANRIKNIKKRLEKVSRQRDQGRRARRKADWPVVAVVGYTNAGKSTLFNRLTASEVYAADQLFATLDPTLRRVQLPGLGRVMFADTVGFIRELPHDLVAAFRATLEETVQADLLLHIVDASTPDYHDTIIAVNEVLSSIGADEIPQLLVYNKIDCCEHRRARLDKDDEGLPRRVWLSAKTGEGCDLLQEALARRLNAEIVDTTLILKPNESELRAKLYALKVVIDEVHDEVGASHLHVRLPGKWYLRYCSER